VGIAHPTQQYFCSSSDMPKSAAFIQIKAGVIEIIANIPAAYKIVGWVARSKTQHQHTNTLEMLGFILQPNLPYLIFVVNGLQKILIGYDLCPIEPF
jgi:hypothetical protein